MNNFAKLLPIVLLLQACGTMQETTQVRDDVYDIPDRRAMAAKAAAEEEQERANAAAAATQEEDYYNAEDAKSAGAYRDYYDLTYNDPYYYNYGRFGFGSGFNSFGPGVGVGYGFPTSFGSMNVGYGTGFYDPYWSNSWMSGYGYGGNPYGYYGYGQYGYGYGGYGQGYGYGYGPYQGPWGGCYGCYEPTGYSSVIYSHRPSMTGTGGGMNTQNVSPRAYRNPAGLIRPNDTSSRPNRDGFAIPERSDRQRTLENRPMRDRDAGGRPARNWSIGRDDDPSRGGNSSPSPSRSGGGDGGRISAPRPR